MKKSLMCLTAVFAFSVANPSFASEPSPESAASLCALPHVPVDVAKKWPGARFPVGGLEAPSVSCHDDKAKFKAGYHFKLFVSPGSGHRIDYLHKPAELQAACWNACIEQQKTCIQQFAKSDAAKKGLCDTQLQACKAINNNELSAFLKEASEKRCTSYVKR